MLPTARSCLQMPHTLREKHYVRTRNGHTDESGQWRILRQCGENGEGRGQVCQLRAAAGTAPLISPYPTAGEGPRDSAILAPPLTWAFPALCLLGTVTLATPGDQNAAFLQADGRICANAPASLDSRKNS